VLVLGPAVVPGQNLLPRGREMRAGEVVVARGSILQPARLGVLAAVGRTEVRVVPRPRVAIVPTGDELVEPGQAPGPGQIRNSNAVMLRALAIEEGARALVLPIAPDEPGALGRILERGLESDLVVISGGVSAGQRDLVPAALDALGVKCIFHKVRLKPGKPLWFGAGPSRGDGPGALVFGLPGNPVSALVGFLLFVNPACRALAGKPKSRPCWAKARLNGGFTHRGDRTTYFPARLVDQGEDAASVRSIVTLDWSGSADLRAASAADGFAVFAAGDRDYAPGEIVDFLPMR
jgi:molybdopterin molybdotransferase